MPRSPRCWRSPRPRALCSLNGRPAARAYPDALAGFSTALYLIWRDGTRMKVDNGLSDKSMDEQLRHGSILDQLRLPYPTSGTLLLVPQQDPGRVRNRAFFDKMYGRAAGGIRVTPRLVPVVWVTEHVGDMSFASRRSAWRRSAIDGDLARTG